jgi:hypothetical protein
VLFKHFETVAYSRTDFLSRSDAHDPKVADSTVDLRSPFLLLLGGLRALGPNAPSDLENGYGSALVGAKDFVAPEGLGMVSSHSCYIGILEDGSQPNIDSDFRQASSESI